MEVSGDGHLEGARSLSRFSMKICIILRNFLRSLADMGPIHWVGVQTWLRSSREVKWRWYWSPGGARSLSLFSLQLCIISRHFLGTLLLIGSIHWVGVQTW